jgi:hypothetical protein
LVDFAPDRPRNVAAVVGAYAAICRELGVPLNFPGTDACWNSLSEATDAKWNELSGSTSYSPVGWTRSRFGLLAISYFARAVT